MKNFDCFMESVLVAIWLDLHLLCFSFTHKLSWGHLPRAGVGQTLGPEPKWPTTMNHTHNPSSYLPEYDYQLYHSSETCRLCKKWTGIGERGTACLGGEDVQRAGHEGHSGQWALQEARGTAMAMAVTSVSSADDSLPVSVVYVVKTTD